MEGQYHRWISAAFRDYGKDPWIFLRELAQNSRDAHANLIKVETKHDRDGNEVIVFKDDGRGMTYRHARQYLFRLYSSSKETDNQAAGMYGIGFWTVLRYNPTDITIESFHKQESWAVNFDAGLNSRPATVNLTAHGTRITLKRKPAFGTFNEFRHAVQTHLSRYCRYLRRNDRSGTPLPIILDGEPVNRPFTLPGQLTHHFKRGSLEGVIGLGKKPKVIIHACGLPVWEGSTLMELSHSVTEQNKKRNFEIGPGLAPVFLLNGNRLSVNFSRRSVLDNRELKTVKKIAERELGNLVQLYASTAIPERRRDRVYDGLKRAGRGIRKSWWKKILLMVLLVVPLEVATLHWFFGTTTNGANPILRVDNRLYTGATVTNGPDAAALDLTYSPPDRALHFKIFSADSYDIPAGFVRGLHQNLYKAAETPEEAEDKLKIRLNTQEAGNIFLPIPGGYVIDPFSIRLNGAPFHGVRRSPSAEITIAVPKKGGAITYECLKSQKSAVLTMTEAANTTSLPAGIKLPSAIERRLPPLMELNTFQKVSGVLNIIANFVKYDASAATAAKYKQMAGSGDWLDQVLTIGQGDCDILNGLNVLLLRKVNVPSRLAIGFIGNNGGISSVAHAWTEYYHDGWHTIDASGIIPLKPMLLETGSRGQSAWTIPAALIGMMIALLMVALFLLTRKKAAPQTEGAEVEKIRENLARLAIGAMLQPSMWGMDSNLWDKRIIPTTRARHISLRQVLRLSRKHKLFAGHPKNPIVKRTKRSRFPVLDIGNGAFRKLIHLLPGVVNLDAVHRLELRPGTPLITAFNSYAASVIPALPLLMWASGLPEGSEDFQVVDLEVLFPKPVAGDCPWHRKIIAINPRGKMVEELGALFSSNRWLALFRLLEAVLRITQEPPATQEKYLEKFSSHLLMSIGNGEAS